MTLAEIEDQVDEIGETWRDVTSKEQRAELVRLDGVLADLDQIKETDSANEAVEDCVAASRS